MTIQAEFGDRHAVRFVWAPGDKECRDVLKITRLARAGTMLTLKLEGEILEPWVRSVRDACAPQGRRSEPLCLDLASVTYVDGAGAQLLRDLLREGIKLAACSGFLTELLMRITKLRDQTLVLSYLATGEYEIRRLRSTTQPMAPRAVAPISEDEFEELAGLRKAQAWGTPMFQPGHAKYPQAMARIAELEAKERAASN